MGDIGYCKTHKNTAFDEQGDGCWKCSGDYGEYPAEEDYVDTIQSLRQQLKDDRVVSDAIYIGMEEICQKQLAEKDEEIERLRNNPLYRQLYRQMDARFTALREVARAAKAYYNHRGDYVVERNLAVKFYIAIKDYESTHGKL